MTLILYNRRNLFYFCSCFSIAVISISVLIAFSSSGREQNLPMSMWRKVFFFPSLAYNLAAEKVTSRRWYDRLDEHVILGALPFRSVLAELKKKENLKGVISFNEDYELNQLWYPTLQEYADVGVEFLQLPVLDYVGVPNRQQVQKALEFIDKIAAENGTVYVHCKAGRFRSAYFAAAYVIKSQGLDAISAVEFVHGKRSQVWLGPKEKQSLQLFHNELYPDRPEKSRKNRWHRMCRKIPFSNARDSVANCM